MKVEPFSYTCINNVNRFLENISDNATTRIHEKESFISIHKIEKKCIANCTGKWTPLHPTNDAPVHTQ